MNIRAAVAALLYMAILVTAGSAIGTLAACAHRDMSRETAIGITELLKQDLKHP